MKSIVIIILYFGRLPKWFELWLKSCKYNDTIDFLLYTDDETKHVIPENVKVKYTSFTAMKSHIQDAFDFPVNIDRPYKLCDFKQAYGFIFENEIEQYDFWGHCDLDQIMGDLRSFLTDEILESREKVYCLGHLTLYRNTHKINRLFQENGWKNWRNILSSPYIYAFDETGMRILSNKHNIRTYDKIECVDVAGHPTYIMPRKGIKSYRHQIFYWENGRVYQCYVENRERRVTEFAYIHFQKRDMHYSGPIPEGFYVIADEFAAKKAIEPPNEEEIQKLNPYPGTVSIIIWRIKSRMQRVRDRIVGKLQKMLYDLKNRA